MPLFSYRARDKTGALITGKLEAVSKEAAEVNIDKMGLIPISISFTRDIQLFKNIKNINTLFQRITFQDVILFSRQLSTLFHAGIPLNRSLFTLERQITNEKLVAVIKAVREDIEGGATFAQALKKYPQVFDETYYSMIEAGEAGGILDSILERLADMKERIQEINAKVKAATLYPKIVLAAIFIAIAVIMVLVVPNFSKLYASFKVELPLPTRILIAISNLFVSYWYLGIAAIIVVIVMVKWYMKTETGKYNWDKWKLKIPIFGALFQKVTMSRFSRTFGALYKSGLPILQSLDIVSRVVNNKLVSITIKDIETNIRGGKSLSELMEPSHLFPPMVVQMVQIGEETGALDEMLEKVAQYYDQEVDHTIRNLNTLLEPVLLVFIFGIVLFLALSVFLPMWDIVKFTRS